MRDRFVRGFTDASTGGLEVGTGQSGVAVPPGLTAQAREAIEQAALATFHEAFTGAMRVSLFLPIALLGVTAVACLLVRRQPASVAEPPDRAESTSAESTSAESTSPESASPESASPESASATRNPAG